MFCLINIANFDDQQFNLWFHPKVKVKHIQTEWLIDEYHWIVQDLLPHNFSIEEIVDAVEKTGGINSITVHNYLAKKYSGELTEFELMNYTKITRYSDEMLKMYVRYLLV